MGLTWLWAVVGCALACASADRGGSSLRGALEALQRRQRGRMSGPVATQQQDYDALYEFVPPEAYSEPDYAVDVEDLDEEPSSKYVIKLLEENDRRPEAYEYRIVKKKNSANAVLETNHRKGSAFRERSHHSDSEKLRDLFMDSDDTDEKTKMLRELADNDAEYALLLGQLWSKYKNHKANNKDSEPQGVVKLYKEKIVKKRVPDSWGPIAFKKKRSSGPDDRSYIQEYEEERKNDMLDDPNYNAYGVLNDGKDDLREEYAIAFQPLEDDGVSDISDDDQYSFDTVEKRFPVTKRSAYGFIPQKKRSTQSQNKRDLTKRFRGSSGTDPKIVKDLSKIFGDSEIEVIKSPVKRSSDHSQNPHEGLPPNLTILPHNNTHDHNDSSVHIEDSHDQHGHNIHHPGLSGKEIEEDHHDHAEHEKPLSIKKKSIDWSNYFGIDKRKKKSVSFVNDPNQAKLRKQYFDTFSKEAIYPLSSFRKHDNVKRNFIKTKANDEDEKQIDNTRVIHDEEKRNAAKDNDSKLDKIDKKLRNMEGLIVDEALHYSNIGEQLDSKEEQETKEKLLSRLAAAYSLEKMRKALKEFKQSIQAQKSAPNLKPSPTPSDEAKAKRVAVKKENVEIVNNDIPIFRKGHDNLGDFEDEQGAGHYLNGKIEDQFSEGYMGGSGRHHSPVITTAGTSGSCPVLARIIQRCHSVDILAGDRGQLFLPLCSLHQICYLCGEAPPTTCDLVFLSEADTTCEGDMGCQRAARAALMALRELHDNLADELDGECETNPCLSATLKLNLGWQRAVQR